jgi:hypothetical protein
MAAVMCAAAVTASATAGRRAPQLSRRVGAQSCERQPPADGGPGHDPGSASGPGHSIEVKDRGRVPADLVARFKDAPGQQG